MNGWVSTYTWDNAVEDGNLIDVTDIASKVGYKSPIAITSNIYHDFLKSDSDAITEINVRTLLMMLASYILANGKRYANIIRYHYAFGKNEEVHEIWVTFEAKNAENPEIVTTIMFPFEY